MTVKTHTSTSAILALSIYAVSNSWIMAASAFFSGILIDLDHLLDFLIFSGENFSFDNLFGWCYERWEKSIYPFHSYELYLVVFAVNLCLPTTITTGILLGTGLHLLLDQIGNRYCLKTVAIRPLFYFMTYRMTRGFRKNLLVEIKKGSDL